MIQNLSTIQVFTSQRWRKKKPKTKRATPGQISEYDPGEFLSQWIYFLKYLFAFRTLYPRYQKMIWRERSMLVRTKRFPVENWTSKLWFNPCCCLTNAIQIRVIRGIIIQILGDASTDNPCLKIDLKPSTIFITPKNIAVVIKNIDQSSAILDVVTEWLIAAGAASPTQIIAKAKTASIWDRLLLATKSKSPFVMRRVKYSPKIEIARYQIARNQIIARGKIYSITDQRPGIKIAARINKTFIDIARVRGRVISVTSAFVVLSFLYSFDFLNMRYCFRFQIKNKICLIA